MERNIQDLIPPGTPDNSTRPASPEEPETAQSTLANLDEEIRSAFTDDELNEIFMCIIYTEQFGHPTPGANRMRLIAKMGKMFGFGVEMNVNADSKPSGPDYSVRG